MKATILVDNVTNCRLKNEWGLSILIEADEKVLFDFGETNIFLENAKEMGIDLENVKVAALSHAHSDHGNGIPYFFETNINSKVYMESRTKENCYTRYGLKKVYEGLPKGTLEKYTDRIEYVSGKTEISKNIFLLSHEKSYIKTGKMEGMYFKEDKKWSYDDLLHEQSLIVLTDNGLNIFSPCSHIGASNIIKEVRNAFPNEKVNSLIGGFHLYNKNKSYIEGFGNELLSMGVNTIYTGHCTGDKAYNILKEILKDKLNKLETGLVIEL